jgi:signal transduction histidine kinase/ligand-binding sensor domain-containing protein
MYVTNRVPKGFGCQLPSLWPLYLWIWLGLGCTPVFAVDAVRSQGQFAHRSWGERDGAPTMPMALAQTSDGYLWAGGADGLIRFDGVRFEAFEPASSVKLPHKAVIHLLALPDGKLWVGFSMGGLSLIDKGKVTNYTEADGLPPNETMEPVQDRDGHIWVSTSNGLARFDGKRWEKIGESWNCPQTSADGIFVDSRGTIWVGIERTILFLRKGSHHFEPTGDFAAQAYQFAEAPDGKVWVADTEHGVRPVGMPWSKRATIAKCLAAAVKKGLNSNGCHGESDLEIDTATAGLLFDHDGGLWMTTLGQGLLRISAPAQLGNHRLNIKSAEVERFTAKEGLSSDYNVPILEDREGNIWVGTRDGLDQFRKTTLVPVVFPSGSRDFFLTPGNDGFMWVVIASANLARLHGEAIPPDIDKTDGFSTLYPTKEIRYFRTFAGLYELAGGRLRKVAGNPNNLVGVVEMVTALDSKGKLWAMVEGEGLFFLDGSHWIRFATPPEICKQRPILAYTDPLGRTWFGFANNIIVKLENSKFETFGKVNGLKIGSAKAIFGRDQHLWIGGPGGLILFDGGKFRSILPPETEPRFHNISGIVESAGHGLWLTSTGGASHISDTEMRKVLNDPNYHPQEEMFDSQDGMPGEGQFSPPFPTAAQGTDGRVWFAAARGVAWVDPSRAMPKSIIPTVTIKAFQADNRAQLLSAPLRVSSKTANFQISYTALSLSIPERVKFRYRLDGLDDSWQDAGTRREAYFSRLRPGHYTFHVIACNGDGLWNETGAALEFVVAPTFFQTTWFTMLCVLCVLALIWVAYTVRIRYVTAQIQQRLGARMEERERIARELHDTLLQGFQGLMLRFQAVMKALPVDEPTHQMMEKVLDRADEVLLEGRQSVRDIREEGTTGAELSEALAHCGEELAREHTSLFSLTVVGEAQPIGPIVFDESYRIAREALINAFQHSYAIKIGVDITYNESGLCLRIRDDGEGIDDAILSKGRSGHWGLSGMRERAQKIGAQLDIWSHSGAGTEIELKIPAEMAYPRSGRESLWERFRRTAGRKSGGMERD